MVLQTDGTAKGVEARAHDSDCTVPCTRVIENARVWRERARDWRQKDQGHEFGPLESMTDATRNGRDGI